MSLKEFEITEPSLSPKPIGINSINNIIIPTQPAPPTTKPTPEPAPTSSTKPAKLLADEQLDDQEVLFKFKTAKITQLISKFTKSATNLPSIFQTTTPLSNVQVKPQQDVKLNTTVLAGIITGIGLVIVIINLGVLFICRRNLKKFLKSSKDTKSPRDDMIQEYFEAFNTLHKNKTMGRGGSSAGVLSAATLKQNQAALNATLNLQALQQQQQQKLSGANSVSSGDELLLHESSKLFYNQSNQSAFKPFARNEELNLLDLQRQLILQQGNQYDKINHHQAAQLAAAQHKLKNSMLLNNESSDQYAHTYESLDTLEMPNRRNMVQLGVNSRNYNRAVDSLLSDGNEANNTNLTDIGNFNVSSSSTSSSSGVSSTHQFIRNNSSNNANANLDSHLLIPNLTQAQLVQLSDMKKMNNLILNSTVNNNNNNGKGTMNPKVNQFLFNGQQQSLFCANTNELINVSNIGSNCGVGSWSPDSAYYSAIPTLTNYSGYNVQPQCSSFNTQQLQQFVNMSFNNNGNANSNDTGYKSHLV